MIHRIHAPILVTFGAGYFVNSVIHTGQNYLYFAAHIFCHPPADGSHCHVGSLLLGEAEPAGGQGRESNAVNIMLLCQLQTVPIAVCQQVVVILFVNGANGVNDVLCSQAIAPSGTSQSRFSAVKLHTTSRLVLPSARVYL